MVGMSLAFTHRPPLAVGTEITATAEVKLLTAKGRTLAFDVRVADGDRDLAVGNVAHTLIDKA